MGSRALRPGCAPSRLSGRGFLGAACHCRLGALTRAPFRPAGTSLTCAKLGYVARGAGLWAEKGRK